MNSPRNKITRKSSLLSLIVSSVLVGSAFVLAAMAMQSPPTGLGGDPIGAAALIVTTTADVIASDGKISLREAVTTANNQSGADTITFNIPASESGCTAPNACTITPVTELPAINDDVTIDGLPNNGHITVSGNNSVRGFLVNPAKTLNVQSLTIANGKGNDCPPYDVGQCGGAIQINGGTVNAANITVMGNTAQTRGGGIAVLGNGIFNLTNSTLSGNSSNEGGGIYSQGTLQVINSTLSGNSAIAGGGGIVNIGTAMLKNSIIANSTRGNCANGGMLTADSHNLTTDGTCGNATTKTASEINLQPLADNGGPTMTMALKLPSAAIDTGDNAVAAAPPINNKDQRGAARPQDGNNDSVAVTDVGAYELTIPLIVTTTDDVIAADGKTSLREAINTANNQPGADTIRFNIPASESDCMAANVCTITLTAALPAINDDLTIDGLPNNGRITISGNNAVRVMQVNSGRTFNLNALTVANGKGLDCGMHQCGGGVLNDGTSNVTNCTFVANNAAEVGGGIANRSVLNVTNSTFFGNSSGSGGGIANYFGATLKVTNCTFSGNGATSGGGMDNSGTATLKNTIIASSTGSDCDNGGTLTADSHNLDSDGSCDNATTKTFAEINLQPLADNGGPTMTMALQRPSAAIDTGDNLVAEAPPVNNRDQRGVTRPRDGNDDNVAVSDVGAYEFGDRGLFVTTTEDVIAPDGKTSLREAITTANNEAGPDTITFNIPANEAGCTAANACTITLATELPRIIETLTIDGLPNNGHIIINGNHTVRSGFYLFGFNLDFPVLNVQNLTLANGNATRGGAIFVDVLSTVNAANITVMGNTAQLGGGVYVEILGNLIQRGYLNVTNSTFVGNSASIGGGIYSRGDTQVKNSTFFGNSAPTGGGIGGTATLKNSIIASNTGGDCAGPTADNFNLDTDGTCGNATTKTAAEINLQPLADNGGPTMTMALKLPSAAVDTGDDAVAAAPPVNNLDQRGESRPKDGDNNGTVVSDVGAFELQPAQCSVCHKSQTLTLPCNSMEYRRHTDHGDPPMACSPPVLEKRK